MLLTWAAKIDPIFGNCFELNGLPRGSVAFARKSDKRYIANAFIGGHYLSHYGGSWRSAMHRLEREIDKRSIGLLGVDCINFAFQTNHTENTHA